MSSLSNSKFTQSDAESRAKMLLDILLPTTREEFKTAFRKAVYRLRPDLATSKVNDLEFIDVKAFYDGLVKQNPSWAFRDSAVQELQTVSGQLLSELGLGLGAAKNGRDCDQCRRKGYIAEKQVGFQRCVICHGQCFGYLQSCIRCKGTGIYTNKKGDATFKCYGCKGIGYFPSHHLVRCPACNGMGGKAVTSEVFLYHFCYTCKGTGEIEIFNPVIPKGRLA